MQVVGQHHPCINEKRPLRLCDPHRVAQRVELAHELHNDGYDRIRGDYPEAAQANVAMEEDNAVAV